MLSIVRQTSWIIVTWRVAGVLPCGMVVLMSGCDRSRTVIVGLHDRGVIMIQMIVPFEHTCMGQACHELVERDGDHHEHLQQSIPALCHPIQPVLKVMVMEHVSAARTLT